MNYWQVLTRNTSEEFTEKHDKCLGTLYCVLILYFSKVGMNFKINCTFFFLENLCVISTVLKSSYATKENHGKYQRKHYTLVC